MSHYCLEVFYLSLQPSDIANFYTSAQITAKITEIETAISNARASMSDSFSDTQASQTVRRQTLDMLNTELSIYLQAYQISTGSDYATATLTAAKYNPALPRI